MAIRNQKKVAAKKKAASVHKKSSPLTGKATVDNPQVLPRTTGEDWLKAVDGLISTRAFHHDEAAKYTGQEPDYGMDYEPYKTQEAEVDPNILKLARAKESLLIASREIELLRKRNKAMSARLAMFDQCYEMFSSRQMYGGGEATMGMDALYQIKNTIEQL